MWWLLTALANPYLSDTPLSAAVEKDPFVWSVPAVTGERLLILELAIPTGYAVYRDQIEVRVIQGKAGEARFPEPKLAVDPSNPQEWRTLYDADLKIELPVQPGTLVLEIVHQGCRKGLCWPRAVVQKKVVVY